MLRFIHHQRLKGSQLTADALKKKFEMKDVSKLLYCDEIEFWLLYDHPRLGVALPVRRHSATVCLLGVTVTHNRLGKK